MAFRLRVGDLAAIFEVYLLAVGLGALWTAIGTSEPWYLETLSLWAYATTLVASTVLVSMLVLAGVFIVRTGRPETAGQLVTASSPRRTPEASTGGANPDIERLLQSLDHAASGETSPGAVLTTVRERVEVRATPTSPEPESLRRGRAQRVWLTLAGPCITSVLFAGISAAFLPGVGGFLQTNYVINTFFILTFAYGWGGLIAYAAASLFLASAQP